MLEISNFSLSVDEDSAMMLLSFVLPRQALSRLSLSYQENSKDPSGALKNKAFEATCLLLGQNQTTFEKTPITIQVLPSLIRLCMPSGDIALVPDNNPKEGCCRIYERLVCELTARRRIWILALSEEGPCLSWSNPSVENTPPAKAVDLLMPADVVA